MAAPKPHNSQVKLSSFYGDVARPYLVFSKDGQVVEDRVDKPSANAPLLAWASKVPFSAGGTLQKPEPPAGVSAPPKARTELALMIDARRADILAANPSLMAEPDSAAFRVAASLFWKEHLTDEERSAFRETAEAERKAEKEATEALAASNPAYAEYLQREAAFKKAKGAINSAHRIAAGPLWKVTAAKQRAGGGRRRRHPKVPEELKMKMRKTRTKHYEVRSKLYARKLAAKRAAERAEEEDDAAEEAAEEAAAAADVAFDIEIEISEASESASESESESESEEEVSDDSEEEEEAPVPAKNGGRKRLVAAITPAKATPAAKKAKKGSESAGKSTGKASAKASVEPKKKGYTDEFELPELVEEKRVTRGAAAAAKPVKKAAVKAKAPAARGGRRKGATTQKLLAC